VTERPPADGFVEVWVNCPDAETARRLADRAVEARLAACANILGEIESTFHWKGAVERSREVPLVLKTRAARFGEVEALIRAGHPYETPGIVALPVTALNADYAAWLDRETGDDAR